MTEEQHEQQREEQEDPDQLRVDDGMGEAAEDQQPETFPSDSVEEDGGTEAGNVKSTLRAAGRLIIWIGVILGILVGIIELYYWLADPSPKIGIAATSGPLSITPKSVDCGKTVKDIPKTVREIIPDDEERTFEQICFVPTHIRNNSDVQLRGALQMVLSVRNQQYALIAASPLTPPLLSPDRAGDTTFIFSIPPGVQPTQLRVSSAVSVEGVKPKELIYEL